MQETIVDESVLAKVHPVRIFQGATGKPLLGAPLQKFRLVIRATGQDRHTELVGNLFDVTEKFTNPFLVSKLKRIVCDEICVSKNITDDTVIYEESLLSSPSNIAVEAEKAEAIEASEKLAALPSCRELSIAEVVKSFKAFKLADICRVLILEEDYTGDKHIIIQFGRLNSLTDYATIPNNVGRSYLKNQNVVFFAMGWGLTLPMRRKLPDNLGKGWIHWIIPTDLKQDSEAAVSVLKQATFLSEIVPYVHQEGVFDDYKRAKDDQINTLRDANNQLAKDIKAYATQNDLLQKVINGLQRHGKAPDFSTPSSFKHFICYALPSILFSLIGFAGYGGIGTIAGVFLGLVTGGFFASRAR